MVDEVLALTVAWKRGSGLVTSVTSLLPENGFVQTVAVKLLLKLGSHCSHLFNNQGEVMSGKLEFRLVVTENDNEVLSKLLSFDQVEAIVYNAHDIEDNADMFGLAARHPASKVRAAVAWNHCLPESVVKALYADKSINVLRRLVWNARFKEMATLEQIEKLLGLDTEIAETIANNIQDFKGAGTEKLDELLVTHADPSVARSLASSYNTPEKLLKTLLTHADPGVAGAAKDLLSKRIIS